MSKTKSQPAVIVKNVTKSFKIPLEAHSGLKQAIINLFRKKKGYRVFTPLQDINFTVNKGDFFGIVGKNGSGKSTLLKTMAGIYIPEIGKVLVDGSLVPFIELGVGFNPELTGRENVYLNGALLGFSHKEVMKMYDDIVKFAELEEFMEERLKNYSSGMQVRLAFSIAIKAKGDVLLLDEVLAVGDAAFQQKCFDYFMDLKKSHKTVILVTHDMSAVRQYCNKAILLESGRISTMGTAEEVAQAYQQMFSVSGGDSSKDEETNRWGNGKMLANKPQVTISDSTVEITTEYESMSNIDTVVVGFSIYGPNGDNIVESNTKVLNHKIAPLKKGEKLSYTWVIPNVFANGRYELSVACCDESTVEFYDWVNKAVTFRIEKEHTTSGIVNPKVILKDNRK